MVKPSTKIHQLTLIILLLCSIACAISHPIGEEDTTNNEAVPTIKITYPTEHYTEAVDGRLILLIAKDIDSEPRFQLRDDAKTCQAFGMDVNEWKAETSLSFATNAFGYPVQNMEELPAGEYYAQVIFHKYETFNRADGKVVKLPMDRGEGQQWNRAPGNLYSTPQKINITDGQLPNFTVSLDQKIAPIPTPEDTKYVKHIRIKSKLLSDFWGRDMYLGAHVLLPEGWEEHPEVKYPLAIQHGHFPRDFGGFRTIPPDPNLKAVSYTHLTLPTIYSV